MCATARAGRVCGVDVAAVLLERWELKPVRLEVLTGGMNYLHNPCTVASSSSNTISV